MSCSFTLSFTPSSLFTFFVLLEILSDIDDTSVTGLLGAVFLGAVFLRAVFSGAGTVFLGAALAFFGAVRYERFVIKH